MTVLLKNIEEASAYLQQANPFSAFPRTAIVLGSGFKHFADRVKIEKAIPYGDIPHFIVPKVQGHGSSLLFARSQNTDVVVLTGRVHLYEGYSPHDVVFSIRALAHAGIKNLILTNAAGGLDANLRAGDILALEDHINLTGQNCLCGDAHLLGKRFVDLINTYDRTWREKILTLPGVKPGIYLGLLGPTYETPAETRLFGKSGAHAVGMSTVQEAIAARQLGLKVAGISFVTNLAAGLSQAVDHQEVLDIGVKEAPRLADLLTHVVAFAN